MVRHRVVSCAAVAALTFAAPALAAGDPVAGDWMTPSGVKVRLEPCAAKRALMCARLIALKEPNDKAGAPLRDTANADASLRGRPLVGILVLMDMKPTGPGAWSDGKVYELNAGKTYDAKMSLNPDGTLKVEGCVSVLCRGVTWTRAG